MSFGWGPWYALLLEETAADRWRVHVHTYPIKYARAERVLRKKPWVLRAYLGPFARLAEARTAARRWQNRKRDFLSPTVATELTAANAETEYVRWDTEKEEEEEGEGAGIPLVMRDVRARQKARKDRKRLKTTLY